MMSEIKKELSVDEGINIRETMMKCDDPNMSEETRNEIMSFLYERMNSAAIKIQSVYRGFKTRKKTSVEMKKFLRRVVLIQSLLRRKAAKKIYLRNCIEDYSARIIQNRWKIFQMARLLKYQELNTNQKYFCKLQGIGRISALDASAYSLNNTELFVPFSQLAQFLFVLRRSLYKKMMYVKMLWDSKIRRANAASKSHHFNKVCLMLNLKCFY
jgi:hypothetical protein